MPPCDRQSVLLGCILHTSAAAARGLGFQDVAQQPRGSCIQGRKRMIGVVATIKVKDGQGDEFVKVASELVQKVNANEKGCLLYALYKSDEPNTCVFLERYKDQAAVEEHRGTEYFKTVGRAMGAFMDGRPDVK